MLAPKLLVLDETEDLAAQVRRATHTSRPRPDVTWCASFDAVGQATTDHGPFDLLIAGSMVGKDSGFETLRRIRLSAPEMHLILAFDRWRSTTLRDTVRTGALDILRLPVSDDELLDALRQALEIGPAPAPRPSDDGRPERATVGGPGTVIAVVSPTGGCGKTFLATNLAYHLQAQRKKQTCLIDLDLQFGELSTALRLRPRSTIYDLVTNEGDDEDFGRRLAEHLEHHESGIRLLSAPAEPAQADAIDAGQVAQVIEAARSRFDYVIVDTPAALSEPVLVAIEQADLVFALATLDLPSVRNLGVMLATLKRLTVSAERIKLLLNKVEPDVGIDVARVEQYFPQGFAMVIPYGREVNRSLNMGQPVLAYAPRGDVSRALASGLVRSVLEDGVQVADPDRKAHHRFLRPRRKSA